MRRRLIGVHAALLALVVTALAVPLAIAVTARDTAALVAARLGDAGQLAAVAQPALTGQSQNPGPPTPAPGTSTSVGMDQLTAALTAYGRRTGVDVVVVDRTGHVVAASRPDLTGVDPDARAAIATVLAGPVAGTTDGGGAVRTGGLVWPWQSAPLRLVVPVGPADRALGAVAIRAPTGPLRHATLLGWALIASTGVLLMAASLALLDPVVRRVVRPVQDLDRALQALSVGRWRERLVWRTGPPDLRHLAGSFNAMAERTGTLVQRQQAFASYASHQLRAPLAALRIRADSLTRQLSVDSAAGAGALIEEIDRLAAICDGLLAFARAEASSGRAEDVDVAAVVEARIAAWRPLADRTGAVLRRTGDRTAMARVSGEIVAQSLDVLIDNALKFGGTGTTVTVAVRSTDTEVAIHVIDDGPGMSVGDLARAAGGRWRGGGEGSGLGLTIAAALIGAAGGRLHLSRAQPHGVDARITVPVLS